MMTGFSTRSDPIRTVAVTVEDSPDLGAFGVSHFHVKDALAQTALGVMQLGRSLVYRGNLEQEEEGFLDYIHELFGAYLNHPYHDGPIRVTSYLAWPDHITVGKDELTAMVKLHLDNMVSLVLLGPDGRRLNLCERLHIEPHEPSAEVRHSSVAAAHRVICENSDARIIAGGAFEGENGFPPDIAEQALLSLQAKQPLYLLGTLGGCTRAIAESLGIVERWSGSRRIWPGSDAFNAYGMHSLENQLSAEENQVLANTIHFDRAMYIAVDGFDRIRESMQPKVA